MPHNIREDDNIKFLIEAILELRNLEEGYDFFEDLCTIAEIKEMAKRISAAHMLSEGKKYVEIAKETHRSQEIQELRLPLLP